MFDIISYDLHLKCYSVSQNGVKKYSSALVQLVILSRTAQTITVLRKLKLSPSLKKKEVCSGVLYPPLNR